MKIQYNLKCCTFFIVLVICCVGRNTFAMSDSKEVPNTVRIGWYDYAGFFMEEEQGYRSGYGYDYFQEIARHVGWNYEYISGTVTECVERLERGEIDLIGAVMKTSDREKIMNFSSLSMGKNYSILTTLADNKQYHIGKKNEFDGIHIGALRGDARQEALQQYAKEQGFSYKLTQYSTPSLMEQALKQKQVDAILTTNMRVASGNEKMIAQFSPVEFYFVTAKENKDLIQIINLAMEQIEYTHKGFQAELAQKYFSVDRSGSFSLTEEEHKFIEENSEIKVILPALRKPIAYKENGNYKGIVLDIMNEMAKRLGITFQYQTSDTQAEGIQALTAGKVDIIANVYTDYGWAEFNQLFLSNPYMTLGYVAITNVGEQPNNPDLHVAAVKGYRFSTDYVEHFYSPQQITWYENEMECLKAVKNKKQDICFVSSYAASEVLSDYRYRELYSSMISYSHGLSVGVSKNSKDSKVLVSLIDKAIASIGKTEIENIIDRNTMLKQRDISFNELLSRYPLQFISVFAFVILIIVTLLAIILVASNQRKMDEELYKARLASEHDALTGLYNRLAFEIVVTQRLQEKKEDLTGAFVMLDVDNFKQVNDQNGHSYGDKVLLTLADGMRMLFEKHDALLGRMGGDEFAIFFPECKDHEEMMEWLWDGQYKLQQGMMEGISIPCSFGVAFVSESLCDFVALYKAADKALYCAKRQGKGTVRN